MPHFNDEPCPCGRGQAMAELAAELVKLKEIVDEVSAIATTAFDMGVTLATRAGFTDEEFRAAIMETRGRIKEVDPDADRLLNGPGEPKEGG